MATTRAELVPAPEPPQAAPLLQDAGQGQGQGEFLQNLSINEPSGGKLWGCCGDAQTQGPALEQHTEISEQEGEVSRFSCSLPEFCLEFLVPGCT